MSARIRLMNLTMQGVYVCRTCGAQALGACYKVEVRDCTPAAAEAACSQLPPAASMPVGWGNYSAGFRCPEDVAKDAPCAK